jgi:alkylation response protein AidB-like acyl-CoA dehydrogenase
MTSHAIAIEAPREVEPAGTAGVPPKPIRTISAAVAEIGRRAESDPAAARAWLYHLVAIQFVERLGLAASKRGESQRRYGWSRPRYGTGTPSQAAISATPLREGGWLLRGRQSLAVADACDEVVLLVRTDVAAREGLAIVLPTGDEAVSLAVNEPVFDRPGIRNGWISLDRPLADDEVRILPALSFDVELRRAALLEELLHAALDHGLLRGFAAKAHIHLTTRSRPWQGQSLEKATYDPHVVRRYGEYVSILDALTELVADAQAALEALGDTDEPEGLRIATDAVATARSYATLAGRTLINGTIELLGASATSEKYGFDVFWRDFTAHAVHDAPAWTLDAIGRALIADREETKRSTVP